MSRTGYSAYKTAQNHQGDGRDTEYRLLAQVTSALMSARDNPKDVKAKVDALLWNAKIWSTFRIDLYSDENQLPQALRASLISLSLWVDRETHAAMDGTSDLDSLIEVNRNIMAGLKPESVTESAPQMTTESVAY
jgi:flagellar protein FlaF